MGSVGKYVTKKPERNQSDLYGFQPPIFAWLTFRLAFAGSFSDERVHEKAFLERRKKVKTLVHEEWGWATDGRNPIVTVILKNGKRLVKELAYAKGQPPELLSVEAVIEKYRVCTEKELADEKINRSIRLILELEKLDPISELIDTIIFSGNEMNS